MRRETRKMTCFVSLFLRSSQAKILSRHARNVRGLGRQRNITVFNLVRLFTAPIAANSAFKFENKKFRKRPATMTRDSCAGRARRKAILTYQNWTEGEHRVVFMKSHINVRMR